LDPYAYSFQQLSKQINIWFDAIWPDAIIHGVMYLGLAVTFLVLMAQIIEGFNRNRFRDKNRSEANAVDAQEETDRPRTSLHVIRNDDGPKLMVRRDNNDEGGPDAA
jgi:hypothetical protein